MEGPKEGAKEGAEEAGGGKEADPKAYLFEENTFTQCGHDLAIAVRFNLELVLTELISFEQRKLSYAQSHGVDGNSNSCPVPLSGLQIRRAHLRASRVLRNRHLHQLVLVRAEIRRVHPASTAR
eukprot:410363-Pyramimonas_sp.AAC.1